MNKAVEFAKEIVRKQEALKHSTSGTLRNDYRKCIRQSLNDLRFYCECKKIDMCQVMGIAKE